MFFFFSCSIFYLDNAERDWTRSNAALSRVLYEDDDRADRWVILITEISIYSILYFKSMYIQYYISKISIYIPYYISESIKEMDAKVDPECLPCQEVGSEEKALPLLHC